MQALLLRPFFRVLGALLGVVLIAGGAVLGYVVLTNAGWIGVPILLLGIGIVGFGILLEILVVTGGLPAWAIGRLEDESSADPA